MDSRETFTSGSFVKSTSVARDEDDKPIGLISARTSSSGLTGVSMEPYMQSFHQQQQQLLNNKGLMSPHCPAPPVAMSLRTRESSAMALKHIFDQQISNGGASSREQDHNSTQRQHIAGFQGSRNQSMPDLRKRMSDLDLAFTKTQGSNFPYAQLGFGSPISTPTNQSSLSQAPLPPINSQLMQHNHMPQAAAASTRLSPSSRQSTAQMTIFYSGNVNVYDDVPAEKAHAIMLLAGNSWSSSSSFKCPAPPSAAPASPAEAMMGRERAPLPVKATPSHHAPATPTSNNGGAIAKSFSSPASATAVVAASLASPPPSPAPAPAPLADGIKSSQAGAGAKRPHAGIELPHARKASLARFLEKRKDRVQVVQEDQQGGTMSDKGGGEPTSCNDEPDRAGTALSSKRQCSSSRSPSPPRNHNKANNMNNNASEESPFINKHRFFH